MNEATNVSLNLGKIKDFMVANKLSEYGLSKKMSVSYSYVFRVMRGKREPGQKFINGLIQAGMVPNDIFLIVSLPKGNNDQQPA